MVRKTEVTTICDRCGSSRSVASRQIGLPRNRRFILRTFDACQQCRDEVSLSEWEQSLVKAPRGGARVVVDESVVEKARRPRPK